MHDPQAHSVGDAQGPHSPRAGLGFGDRPWGMRAEDANLATVPDKPWAVPSAATLAGVTAVVTPSTAKRGKDNHSCPRTRVGVLEAAPGEPADPALSSRRRHEEGGELSSRPPASSHLTLVFLKADALGGVCPPCSRIPPTTTVDQVHL